jgi:hypothetical protein
MMPPPVRGGYAARCPGTDGNESHIFYMRTKPNPKTTYYCPKCHPFLQLDRIARDVSKALNEDEKAKAEVKETPAPKPCTGKSIEELLAENN